MGEGVFGEGEVVGQFREDMTVLPSWVREEPISPGRSL